MKCHQFSGVRGEEGLGRREGGKWPGGKGQEEGRGGKEDLPFL